MNREILKFFCVFILLSAGILINAYAKQSLSDAEIRQIIIQHSISQYPGVCACPYSITRNGSKCGGRSAYSKPGGFSPLCFPKDVPEDYVERYKNKLQ
jgi:hypothetical protein